MRDKRRCENSKHQSRATNYLITLWLLHIFSFESALQSSFEFFARIHLLLFGCLFLVGQRLARRLVLSKRLENKSAWSSSSEVLLHVFSDIINFRVFWVKIHFGIIVIKNRNLLILEFQRKAYAAKWLLHSCKIEDLTGTAEAFVLDLTSQL